MPFLPESKKVNKVQKLICDIEDKKNNIIHIRALKQALNCGLRPKKVHRIIQFKQKAWLKVYIDMNTELRKIRGMNLRKISLNLCIILFLEKLWKM